MQPDERLIAAARQIYRVCFTAAPIDFDEATRRGTLMAQRAIEAAEMALGVASQEVAA